MEEAILPNNFFAWIDAHVFKVSCRLEFSPLPEPKRMIMVPVTATKTNQTKNGLTFATTILEINVSYYIKHSIKE